MRRSIRVTVVTAALFLVFPVAVVQANPGLSVHFDVQTTLNAPSGGPFIATGVAVDNGLVCPAGSTIDASYMWTGGQSKAGGSNYQVLKDFICDNESGSLLLKLQVRIDPNRGSTYSWTVVGGTGLYTSLRGSGTGYGLPTEYGVNDLLFGTVHN